MEELAKTVRHITNPAELEAWAAKIISNTPREGLFTELSTNGAPKGVRNLLTNNATLYFMLDGLSNDAVVVFTAGGGFGHWGFAVGTFAYTCGLGSVQSHLTNGIWFWTE